VSEPNHNKPLVPLKEQGIAQDAMYRAFEEQLLRYRSSEHYSEVIAAVMDRIAGWCRPESRLFDTELKT
jgi:hypothetical protein